MKIGVSGASGKLGAATLAELAKRAVGHQIVGISRTPNALPVEGRLGDYDRPETLSSAYSGLDRLLIIPTADLRPGKRAEQNVAAIDAAVAAGVPHIVFLSAAGTRAVQEPAIGAGYYAGEQRLMGTAPKWSIVRMNYYAEALAEEAKASLAHGAITSLAENRVAFVSRNDIAAAIAGLLVGEGNEGAIYNLTGPRSLTGAARTTIISDLAGKPLSFTVLPEEALRAGLAGAGLPDDVVNAVVSIQKEFAVGSFDIVTGDIEHLAGKPPRPLEDVLAQAFASV